MHSTHLKLLASRPYTRPTQSTVQPVPLAHASTSSTAQHHAHIELQSSYHMKSHAYPTNELASWQNIYLKFSPNAFLVRKSSILRLPTCLSEYLSDSLSRHRFHFTFATSLSRHDRRLNQGGQIPEEEAAGSGITMFDHCEKKF